MKINDYFSSTDKILITGGAGFIGTNLANVLSNSNLNITVIDDLSSGEMSEILKFPNIKFIKEDIRNIDNYKNILSTSDYIFHLAARNIGNSIANPTDNFDVNCKATFKILEFLRINNKKLKRFIYSSSCVTTCPCRRPPINECDTPNILSPYAASKYSAENFCVSYYENYNLPISIVRFSNVYGPYQYIKNYSGIISKIFNAALNNHIINIHGDGEQTRDYTFIDDSISALILVAINNKSIGEVYNIGTGIETSVNKLVDLIQDILKIKLKVKYIDYRDIDNIRRRVLNVEKIRKDLKWFPLNSLKNGLNLTYNYYKNI